jgi:LysM repeat protein
MIVDQLFTIPTAVGNTRQFFSESRHNKLLKEDVTYRNFHNLSRMLAERKMSEKEILDLFAAIEASANATGQNRTALGRGKDAVTGAYTSAKDAIGGVLNSIAKSTPVAGVDAAYNDATGALRNAVGANSKVMDSIKKYRLLAKEYPKTQLFVKTALIALAGMATGGAGLPAIAGLTAAIDSAIRGEKLSSIIGKGAGAALMGLGAQQLQAALSTPSGTVDQIPSAPNVPVDQYLSPGESIVNTDTPLPQGATVRCPLGSCDGDVWQVKPGETLNDIAQQIGVPPQELAQLNPGLGGPGGTYTVMKGDQLGFIAQAQGTTPEAIRAANPDINFAKALKPGTELNLPASTPGQGSVWSDYKGGMYGDKAPVSGQSGGVDASSTTAATTPAGKITGPTNLGPNFDPNNVPPGWTMKQAPSPVDATAGTTQRYIPQNDGTWIDASTGQIADPAKLKASQDAVRNALRTGFNESITLKTLPADQLIDQKLTVMAWALNESTGRAPTRNIHLTRKGVLTVIENVDRHRRSLLKELDAMGPSRTNIPAVPRQDMPLAPQAGAVKPGVVGRGLNWLDRTAGKVGGYFSKQAQNFTRKVTAAKLKTEWEQEGHQTDSDYIAAFLAKQGVPQDVITDVYGKMGIPYSAPAVQPTNVQPQQQGAGIQTGDIYAIDPTTGKPYEKEKLAQMYGSGATTAQTPAPAPTTGKVTKPANMTSITSNPAAFNATNVMQMPDMEKYAKPTAPAKPANFGASPSGYGKVTQTFKSPTAQAPAAPAAPKAPKVTSGGPTPDEQAKLQARLAAAAKAQPVAETIKQVKKMLETVQTKDDVAFIKKYISRQFSGQLSESANAQRSRLLSEVTRIGAQRRRQYSQQLAK